MKSLIKILFVVIVLSNPVESAAQIFGVKAGLNLSETQIQDIPEEDILINPGFHLGATGEFMINGIFSIETGLFLTTKGHKNKVETPDEPVTGRVNLNYLEIPLTGKALIEAGSIKIYGLFGPYAAMGLTGKIKVENTTSENIKWGSDIESDQYKRFDFGLTFGTGVEIESLQIGLSYDLGLASISSQTGQKVTNQTLGVSLGYKFPGK
ncbi:MAG: PorT family protein [Bacteroidales bacterium]|nr:PorT family protein [Bacteroidales bacterium]